MEESKINVNFGSTVFNRSKPYQYKPKEYNGKFVEYKPKEYKPSSLVEQKPPKDFFICTNFKDYKAKTFDKVHEYNKYVEYKPPNVDLFTGKPYSKYTPPEEKTKKSKMKKFGNSSGSILRTFSLIHPSEGW